MCTVYWVFSSACIEEHGGEEALLLLRWDRRHARWACSVLGGALSCLRSVFASVFARKAGRRSSGIMCCAQ